MIIELPKTKSKVIQNLKLLKSYSRSSPEWTKNTFDYNQLQHVHIVDHTVNIGKNAFEFIFSGQFLNLSFPELAS